MAEMKWESFILMVETKQQENRIVILVNVQNVENVQTNTNSGAHFTLNGISLMHDRLLCFTIAVTI